MHFIHWSLHLKTTWLCQCLATKIVFKMLSQSGRSCERLLASFTVVRLQAGVDTLMTLQAPQGPKRLPAPSFLTIVRHFSSVSPHVSLQICFFSVFGLALRTLIPFLCAGVNLSMSFQVLLCCKPFPAVQTQKRSFTRVLNFMNLKM